MKRVLIIILVLALVFVGTGICIDKLSRKVFYEAMDSLEHMDYFTLDIHGYAVETIEIKDPDTIAVVKEAVLKTSYDKIVLRLDVPTLLKLDNKIYAISMFDEKGYELMSLIVSLDANYNYVWNAPDLHDWLKIAIENTDCLVNILDEVWIEDTD